MGHRKSRGLLLLFAHGAGHALTQHIQRWRTDSRGQSEQLMVFLDGGQVPVDGGQLTRDIGQVRHVAGERGHSRWPGRKLVLGTKCFVAPQVGRVCEPGVFRTFEAEGQVAPDVRRDLAGQVVGQRQRRQVTGHGRQVLFSLLCHLFFAIAEFAGCKCSSKVVKT